MPGIDDIEASTLDYPMFYPGWVGNQHRTTRGGYDSADERDTDVIETFDYARLSTRDQREGSHLRIGGDLGLATEQFRFIALVAQIKRSTHAALEDAVVTFGRAFDVQEAQVDRPATRGLERFNFYTPTQIKGLAQYHAYVGGLFNTPSSVWRMGEAHGGFRDRGSVGTAHGSVIGSPTRGAPSIFGDSGPDRGLVATGTGQGADYGDVYLNTGATVWSVTGWVKWGGSTTVMDVLSKVLSASDGWRCQITATGNASLATLNGGTVQAVSGAGTQTPFAAGELHHVAFVFGASELRVYVDGARVGTITRTQNAGSSATQVMYTRLGASGGAIQELAMWQNVELNDAAVWDLYSNAAVRETYYARPDTMPQFRRSKTGGKAVIASVQLVCEDPRRYLYVPESIPWGDLAQGQFLGNWTTTMGRVVHPVLTIVTSGNGASDLTISDGTRSLVLDMSAAGAGTFTIDTFAQSILKGSTRRDDLRTSQPDTFPVVLAGGSTWTMTNRTNVTSASIAYRQAR